MKKIDALPIAFLLFITSFILRLSLISKGPYNVDCLHLALNAEKTLRTLNLQFEFGTGYPLTVIFASLFVFLGKMFHFSSVWSVNFMNVVVSSLAVPVFYVLTKKLFNTPAALFSAILFSICPIFLGISVYGKSQPLQILFLLLGLLFLVQYLETQKISDFLFSGLALGLAAGNRIHEMGFMFIPVSYLYVFGKPARFTQKEFIKFVYFWLLIAGIAVLLHAPYFLPGNRTAYLVQLNRFMGLAVTDNFLGLFTPRMLTGLELLSQTLTWAGLILSFAGLLMMLKTHPRIFGFLLLWFFVPYLYYGNMRMTYTARYLVLLVPPLIISLSYLLAKIYSARPLFAKMTVIAFVFLVNVLYMRIYPNLQFRHDHELLPDFARWVGRLTEPNARIITADERLFMEYYGQRASLGRPLSLLKSTSEELYTFQQQVDALLDAGIPVYITTASLIAYDRDRHFSNFMNEHYLAELIGRHLYEDWHKGEMAQQVFLFDLYKVHKSYARQHHEK